MEQIELCLLHVYSDSDFILQKAQKHTGHTSLGGPAPGRSPALRESLTRLPAYLPACLSSPSLPSHGTGLAGHLRWATLGMGATGTGTPGAGEGAEERCRSVGCSELVQK